MVVGQSICLLKNSRQIGRAFEDLIENIDIGGPSMIRSAATKFSGCGGGHFARRLPRDRRREMAKSDGALSAATKWHLAQKAFATTAAYDSAIASTLERVSANGPFRISSGSRLPRNLRLSFRKVRDLRYGENPHQKASMYTDGSGSGVANGRQIQGKELSYNNIVVCRQPGTWRRNSMKLSAPLSNTSNPCGTATGKILAEAFKKALECGSGICVWRRDRGQSRGGRPGRGRNGQTFSRGDRGPRI